MLHGVEVFSCRSNNTLYNFNFTSQFHPFADCGFDENGPTQAPRQKADERSPYRPEGILMDNAGREEER